MKVYSGYQWVGGYESIIGYQCVGEYKGLGGYQALVRYRCVGEYIIKVWVDI